MYHLTCRVAWHDSRWNGTVCKAPSCNSFCVALDRIREERDEAAEDKIAGQAWADLKASDLPPCHKESAGFMGPTEWTRHFEHPYADNKKTAATHSKLRPTNVKVAPYSTFAVPFNWMLRNNQDDIETRLVEPLPEDDEPPFHSPWIFSRTRQNAILELFFRKLVPEKSLVFFYCKEGQPLGDTISRLVVGVGRINKIAPLRLYDTADGKPGYAMWDRLVHHSIRPDDSDGFLLPYHEYLEPTGDPEEDLRRLGLLREIAVPADAANILTFSYAAELASPDIALSTLVRFLESVRKIRQHGIAKGPWERREEWLNGEIAKAWQDRGAFPGLGSVLEALGMRLGTALSLELMANKTVTVDDDPWPVVDEILRGKRKPPQPAYNDDLKAVQKTWTNLPEERRALLRLLSRVALTPGQAQRWFDPKERAKAVAATVTDKHILANPYRVSEVDLGDRDDGPVSLGMIDRGLLPDATIAAKHSVEEPSRIGSSNDPRRIRAAIVATLRQAAERGDSLLGSADALDRLAELDLGHPCNVGTDWLTAHADDLGGVVEQAVIDSGSGGQGPIPALQLTELRDREDRLRKVLTGRAQKTLPPMIVNWRDLLVQSIKDSGGAFDPDNQRHARAIAEQAIALAKLLSRRLTVLIGRAGTGKTSVMGALMQCEEIAREGILLLAPTGKARVKLSKATKATAMTVAQFLYQLDRYDGVRQRPLFQGKAPHRKEKTVVIDECSMLTMDDLYAILEALDQAHVQRLILVGDPNQLPPIGVGRPFADLVAFLEASGAAKEGKAAQAGALARLTVEVRTLAAADAPSDALRLASWFTREPQPVDADKVVSDLEIGAGFNDLELRFWQTPDELRQQLLETFRAHLGFSSDRDVAGFDASLGLNEKGWVPFDNPNGSERWQILSPVRMHPYGVNDLNRWVQQTFRSKQLEAAGQPWGTSLGDERIVAKDKVIQTSNQWRDAFDGKASAKHYLANGEVGLVGPGKGGFLNILFAGRPNLRFGYRGRDFPGGSGPLELAYALTVHKAQGSEFGKVIVVLPKTCRLLSRELLYTALTRSREQLVLLIEGADASILFDLTKPEKSETARRNTNLFRGVIRDIGQDIPYAEHLIHRADDGTLVRSKSELVIANMLCNIGLRVEYERVCEGTLESGRLRPDFSFTTAAGDLLIWEHLGMLNREDYARGWEWKKAWYQKNGYVPGQTLFTTQDDEKGGLDSGQIRQTALAIKALL